MILTEPAPKTNLATPVLPAWIMDRSVSETLGSKTLEEAAFASGSALALLHAVLAVTTIKVPSDLLRKRLALRAAANCCKIEGRGETEAEIRDAYLLTAPGDDGVFHRGPGGDMLALWTAVAGYSLRRSDWVERYVSLCPEHMRAFLLELFSETPEHLLQGTPIARAGGWARTVLEAFPRQETIALQCADIALAKALGWPHPVPVCGLHVKRSDVRNLTDGEPRAFDLAFTNGIAAAANDATRLAHDLARRAERLRAVAPKLRAKGSDTAVELFLSEDSVAPSTMLAPQIRGTSIPMTPRAARRLCDRLVELGVVRELTGRPTFRLYGVA